MPLDKKLERRFRALERENQILKTEVKTLKNPQTNQKGPKGAIETLLKVSTLGKIQNKKLYMPSDKLSPVGPRFRRRQ